MFMCIPAVKINCGEVVDFRPFLSNGQHSVSSSFFEALTIVTMNLSYKVTVVFSSYISSSQ